jgi:predicted ribosomally synthesized peptide with nif11-like leader
MSTENITLFLNKISTDSALAERLHLAIAQALSALAEQEGQAFTAEEFLSHQQMALSDADLSGVAGGTTIADDENPYDPTARRPLRNPDPKVRYSDNSFLRR